jgi:hypothetical protein
MQMHLVIGSFACLAVQRKGLFCCCMPRHKAVVLCCVTLVSVLHGEESIDSTFQEKKPFWTTPVSCPSLGLWLWLWLWLLVIYI